MHLRQQMDTERIIFQAEWITVKESSRGFQYLERKGKDSVAVFLLRKNSNHSTKYDVLIRRQPLCIDNQEINGMLELFSCPITGAIDEGESPETTATREAYEETGYVAQVLSLGRYIVGTQTNEICYLYYADVTNAIPSDAQQDGSYFESISRNEWYSLDYLKSCDYSACQIGYFRLQEILFSAH